MRKSPPKISSTLTPDVTRSEQQLSPENDSLLDGSRKSLSGYEFEPSSDKWLLAKGVTADVGSLRDRIIGPLAKGVIGTLVYYAERKAARSVTNICYLLREYFDLAAPEARVKVFKTEDLLNYRGLKRAQDGHDDRLIKIRPFFRNWHKLGQPGVSDPFMELLNSLSLKSAESGKAVLQLDPEDGPLEPAESAGLKAGVLSAYERGAISHEMCLASLLLSYTGRRPIQMAHLKLKDLDGNRLEDSDANDLRQSPRKLLLLHIPRAKQGTSKFREQLRSIEVIPALWAALVRQRAEVIDRFEKLLLVHGPDTANLHLTSIVSELPFFPAWQAIERSLTTLATGWGCDSKKLAELQELAASDRWHRAPPKLGNLVIEAAEVANVSSRTGQPLKSNSRRLRYTKGTDAARAGYGKQVIAELLDHSTTSSVDIYTKTVPEHARPINKAMALAMAPLVQLFRGRLVDRETDANGGNDPSATRILYKGEGTATCGTSIRCGLSKLPRPCYTCDSFQPWLDGPHEMMLEELLRERQERAEILGNPTMVGIDDNTIIAVINVIQRCDTRRAELRQGSSAEEPTLPSESRHRPSKRRSKA